VQLVLREGATAASTLRAQVVRAAAVTYAALRRENEEERRFLRRRAAWPPAGAAPRASGRARVRSVRCCAQPAPRGRTQRAAWAARIKRRNAAPTARREVPSCAPRGQQGRVQYASAAPRARADALLRRHVAGSPGLHAPRLYAREEWRRLTAPLRRTAASPALLDAGASPSAWSVVSAPPADALSPQAGLTLDGTSRGVVLAPSAPLADAALTISLTARYTTTPSDGTNLTRTVFNLGGLTFRIAPFAIDVGVPVSSFAYFANANGASMRCSQGFYLISDYAGFASWLPDTDATLEFTVDADGMVGVPSINGDPFELVDYHAVDPLTGLRSAEVPWVPGCKPVSLGTDSALYVGNGGAESSAADFKGDIKSLSIDYAAPPPATTPALPPAGSCLEIRARAPTAASGWFNITSSLTTASPSSLLRVWCDLATDGGGYTFYPCTNCAAVSTTTAANGCDAVGLHMVIPRTQAMWGSMKAFVVGPLGSTLATYFQTVPGISKPGDGRLDCAGGKGVMHSAACAGIANGWRATDGGNWWLHASTYGCGRLDEGVHHSHDGRQRRPQPAYHDGGVHVAADAERAVLQAVRRRHHGARRRWRPLLGQVRRRGGRHGCRQHVPEQLAAALGLAHLAAVRPGLDGGREPRRRGGLRRAALRPRRLHFLHLQPAAADGCVRRQPLQLGQRRRRRRRLHDRLRLGRHARRGLGRAACAGHHACLPQMPPYLPLLPG
jgi:hypothetical protein